jgi:hypothetical protein
MGRSGLGYALADSGGLSPRGLGCTLTDLGCALVAWTVPLQFGAAPLWLGLRPPRLGWAEPLWLGLRPRRLGLCPCGLSYAHADSGCVLVAWAAPS